MPSDNGLPSRQELHAERQQVKAEIAQCRMRIAMSRALTVKLPWQFADSADRVAES